MNYVYVFVRKDLDIARQMVQACHATHHAGARLGAPDGCYMVLCHVDDEKQLLSWSKHLKRKNIDSHLFFEPDINAHTAFCTRPVSLDERALFKKAQLAFEKGPES